MHRYSSNDDNSCSGKQYLGNGSRADQSALDHIRRIRRNLPSQQNSRMSNDVGYDYLSNKQAAGAVMPNNNYKRNKQEEAAARAMLMVPREPGSASKAKLI